jgi:divalent metal cation (Fe/Co/Zn/Cd) transporter
VREVHNVSVLDVDGNTEVSLHLKLPGDLRLEDAHEVATAVEHAIVGAVPEVDSVQTHLEPLSEAGEGRDVGDVGADAALVERIVRETTGRPPRELRFLNTDEGLLAHLTLALDPGTALADAHARASEIEERIRRERPEIADVIVHTEP